MECKEIEKIWKNRIFIRNSRLMNETSDWWALFKNKSRYFLVKFKLNFFQQIYTKIVDFENFKIFAPCFDSFHHDHKNEISCAIILYYYFTGYEMIIFEFLHFFPWFLYFMFWTNNKNKHTTASINLFQKRRPNWKLGRSKCFSDGIFQGEGDTVQMFSERYGHIAQTNMLQKREKNFWKN